MRWWELMPSLRLSTLRTPALKEWSLISENEKINKNFAQEKNGKHICGGDIWWGNDQQMVLTESDPATRQWQSLRQQSYHNRDSTKMRLILASDAFDASDHQKSEQTVRQIHIFGDYGLVLRHECELRSNARLVVNYFYRVYCVANVLLGTERSGERTERDLIPGSRWRQ